MAQAPAAKENVKQEQEQKQKHINKRNNSKNSHYSCIISEYIKKKPPIVLKPISSMFQSAKHCHNMLKEIYITDCTEYIESKQTVILSPYEWEYEFSLHKFYQHSSSDINIEGGLYLVSCV